MQRGSGNGGGGGNKGTGAGEALTAGGEVCDVGVNSGVDDVDRGAVQGYAVLVERINDLVSVFFYLMLQYYVFDNAFYR